MIIESAEVVVTSPDRNFVTLRLTTDDGLVGLGDATLNGREQSVVAYLAEHVAPLLIGRDAHRVEDTWQFLYRGAYWRRGPVTMAAIAAVDVALWDLKAQAAGMPLYQLLGGASRTGLLAYGHASGSSLPALFESIHRLLEEGYRAIRVQTSVPGLDKIYGISTGHYEPAGRAPAPVEEDWDSRSYLRHLPGVFEAVRAEFGPALPLLHDVHHRLTPIEAARLGKALEPYDLFWLEDCTPAEDPSAVRLVRQHTTTPLAIGEVFNSVHDYSSLISERLIDYVRSAVTHTGGITHLKRILEYAGQYGIKSGIHGPTDISPVGMAAALHLGLAVHNFGIQEYMKHGALSDSVFAQSFTFVDGLLHPGSAPGLGVQLDLDAAGRFPYQTAYLPINRLKDGTLHDW
jgi:mannonate dehydratase